MGVRRVSALLVLVVGICLAGWTIVLNGQIVLNGPNVSGTVGR